MRYTYNGGTSFTIDGKLTIIPKNIVITKDGIKYNYNHNTNLWQNSNDEKLELIDQEKIDPPITTTQQITNQHRTNEYVSPYAQILYPLLRPIFGPSMFPLGPPMPMPVHMPIPMSYNYPSQQIYYKKYLLYKKKYLQLKKQHNLE